MNEMNNRDVVALITSFNPTKRLINLVDILSRDPSIKRVLIYDNDSKDLSLLNKIENDHFNFVNIEYSENNDGIGVAYNFLIEKYYNNETFIVTFDQDSIPEEGMVSALRNRLSELHQKNEKFISIGPKIASLSTQFNVTSKQALRDRIIVRPILITAGNLYYTDAFFSIMDDGGYDEEMFIDCVDYDFSLKLRSKGYWLCVDHSVHLYQDDETSDNGIRIYGESRLYYMIRNRIILNRKYFLRFPIYIIMSTMLSIPSICQQLHYLDAKQDVRLLLEKAYQDAGTL